MPESRKRPGHHDYQKPSDIPASQRTKGRITWAILIGIFGLLLSYFLVSDDYAALAIGAVVGAVIGYFVGIRMEKDARHK